MYSYGQKSIFKDFKCYIIDNIDNIYQKGWIDTYRIKNIKNSKDFTELSKYLTIGRYEQFISFNIIYEFLKTTNSLITNITFSSDSYLSKIDSFINKFFNGCNYFILDSQTDYSTITVNIWYKHFNNIEINMIDYSLDINFDEYDDQYNLVKIIKLYKKYLYITYELVDEVNDELVDEVNDD
jgi:hypothetical protein